MIYKKKKFGLDQKINYLSFLLPIFLVLLLLMSCSRQSVGVEELNDKVIVKLDTGEIHISPLAEYTIRIQYAVDFNSNLPELVLTEKLDIPDFQVSES